MGHLTACDVRLAVNPFAEAGEVGAEPSNAEQALDAGRAKDDEFAPELPVPGPRLLVVATTGASGVVHVRGRSAGECNSNITCCYSRWQVTTRRLCVASASSRMTCGRA